MFKTYYQRWREKITKLGPDDCWLWRGARDGYKRYGIMRYEGRNHQAHRIAYLLKHGSIDPDKDCCHSCDTPLCQNPKHLFLGTVGDNMKDAYKKGRKTVTGSKNPNSIYTETQVLKVRAEFATGLYTIAEVARRNGMKHNNAWQMVHRAKWTHI